MFAISIAAAADTQIELDGLEKVENRDAYKLILTMKDGHSIHVRNRKFKRRWLATSRSATAHGSLLTGKDISAGPVYK
jgi:hypothetical protein